MPGDDPPLRMDMLRPPHVSRGWPVLLAGASMLVLGAIAWIVGIGMTWASSGFGDTTVVPAVVGTIVGAGCLLAAFGTWTGRWSLGSVLALCSLVPAACLVASPGSADLGAAAIPALAWWLATFWLLTRPAARAWRSR